MGWDMEGRSTIGILLMITVVYGVYGLMATEGRDLGSSLSARSE